MADTTTTTATAPAPERLDEDGGSNEVVAHSPPPILSRISYLSRIYTAKSLSTPLLWLRDWKEYFYPPSTQPDIVKSYECRPDLPVRIFFPSSYDLTSPHTLPTLFTIHGSVSAPFCLGDPRDNDEWNRSFADRNNVLVIALDYSKAPGAVFPAPVWDVEAVLLAALGDESLPMDRMYKRGGDNKKKGRIGILGFGAGGNFAMAVTMLEEVRKCESYPSVVVSWGGWLDLATPGGEKKGKGGVNGEEGEVWRWGCVPYGQDLQDPRVSPFYGQDGEMPEYKGFIAGEGDVLAWENWALARRLVGKGEVVRNEGTVCGREEVGNGKGLEREDERFYFEEGMVKWLLVPDVGPGFEHRGAREDMGLGEEVVKDAEEKTEEVMLELGRWLKRVWEIDG
ncbi:Alpha/Beta hydrolase protein [Triangularia verruculosa]|uniref:Alpha/Beta hydrolase protein n=1 Tax=Triangularia verruculosa TaxID=2587418 RepID=A0AAN7ASA5_9PEZI|nr:Alpha/Beta hydrolase protein [Triangularia verruculosa]